MRRNIAEHRRASHALGAGGDHDVLRAGHYRLGQELHRLLRAAALPIDGDGRYAVGQPRGSTALRPKAEACSPACITQPMITSSIAAGSIPVRSTRAFSTSPPGPRGAIRQLAVPATASRADRLNNIGLGHWFILHRNRVCVSPERHFSTRTEEVEADREFIDWNGLATCTPAAQLPTPYLMRRTLAARSAFKPGFRRSRRRGSRL
jgi:hypothetical protein